MDCGAGCPSEVWRWVIGSDDDDGDGNDDCGGGNGCPWL